MKFTVIAALAGAAFAWAAGPPAREPVEVTKAIAQLADDDSTVRRAAMARLEKLGEPAVPALRRVGRSHADLDVRLRAHAVAAAIEAGLYGEERRFIGHTGHAVVVAVSPDGKALASGAWMGQGEHVVRIWDVQTGKNTRVLKGHTDGVTALAFLPDGKRLISGSGDRTVRVWDVAKGAELLTVPGHLGVIHSVAVSGDGELAVSCCAGRHAASVWDVARGKVLRYLYGHDSTTRGLAFIPGTKRCLSASFDGTVRLWDAASGKELARLPHGQAAWFVAAPAGGRRAASVGADGRLRIWDLAEKKLLRTVEAHRQGAHGVAYSPDGKRILTCSCDHAVRLWGAESGEAVQVLDGHSDLALCVAFLPGGRQAVSSSADKTLRLWNLRR